MASVVVEKTITLASAPSDVWPLITDTDRTNRVLAAPAAYKAIEKGAKSSARFVVTTRTGGFALEYEEAPFEWTVNKRMSVYRKMRSGPMRSYLYAIVLEPTRDGGTRATLRLELEPRWWPLTPLVRLSAARSMARLEAIAVAIDAHLVSGAPSPYVEPTARANEERLAYAERALRKRGLDAKAIATLIELVRSGADADIVRIRPFELAEDKGVAPREMLRTLLHAVTLGVVEMRWALVCPSCRTANDQALSLAEIGDASHCQLCDITYGIELDRAVEATFRPHPSVREVHDQMFCIGGPWRTPHVLAQMNLDAKETREIEAPMDPGRYRLFARGGLVAPVEVAEGAAARAAMNLGASFEPMELGIAPGGVIAVANESGEPLHVKLERLGYASRAATAHVVTTMSEFRRLFSKDLLKPSTPLKVGHCTILFSDLTGSTALYTKAGDAAAFRLVDDHFDVLRKTIDEAGGTVVKTMGDAVMASFVEARACVRAAIASLRAFEAFRASHPYGGDTGLKLGLFAGPCYVVTANDAIDYFGQTVNCASRVQHLAESGQIVMEESLYEELPRDERAALRVVEKLETRVKGVEEPLRLVRTCVASADGVGVATSGTQSKRAS
jgi:class 3 adenylate cyclase